jgi:hypothetical protein
LRAKKNKKKKVKEELIENQVRFFYAVQGLEVTRKYIQQLNMEDDIVVCAVSSKTSCSVEVSRKR